MAKFPSINFEVEDWLTLTGVILVSSVVVPYVLHEVPDIVEGMREAGLGI
ncbi:hypothetical protein [Companilactobacillus sp. HBUAS59544]